MKTLRHEIETTRELQLGLAGSMAVVVLGFVLLGYLPSGANRNRWRQHSPSSANSWPRTSSP